MAVASWQRGNVREFGREFSWLVGCFEIQVEGNGNIC